MTRRDSAAVAARRLEDAPGRPGRRLESVDAGKGQSRAPEWDPAPWILGTCPGELRCHRCGALVNTGPCDLCVDVQDSVAVAVWFIGVHLDCEEKA